MRDSPIRASKLIEAGMEFTNDEYSVCTMEGNK